MTTMDSLAINAVAALLASHISDADTSWSVGTFGAVAEFRRDADEAVCVQVHGRSVMAATARGALRIDAIPGLRAVAYETVSGHPEHWSHAIALCLPKHKAPMHRRKRLLELGPDADALQALDCSAVLFDMGLNCLQVDVCVRSAEAGTLALLRSLQGCSVTDPGNPLMQEIPQLSPHRVFVTRCARAEVYQRVPPPHGVSPEGPHTHVLPKLMREYRTHAANVPIPYGFVPCAHIYPAHPTRDCEGRPQPFDENRHRSFQTLLQQFGDTVLWTLKQRVMVALDAGAAGLAATDELSFHERDTVRVAIRQWALLNPGCMIDANWVKLFFPPKVVLDLPSKRDTNQLIE
jgi:hypothetical protein